AVVYVPQVDAETIAAVTLGAAGAGYRLRGITYQRDALIGGSVGAAAICDFDRDVPLLRDQGLADPVAIEDAIRAGVREAILARGEPIGTDRAAVAALAALARQRLLAARLWTLPRRRDAGPRARRALHCRVRSAGRRWPLASSR